MNLVFMGLGLWAVFMGAWFVVSKYFKSADVTRVKERLRTMYPRLFSW